MWLLLLQLTRPIIVLRVCLCCPCPPAWVLTFLLALAALSCPPYRSGPREDATRIGSAGVVRRQAVDISPLRRVNQVRVRRVAWACSWQDSCEES